MANTDPHPRTETQEQRDAAYKALNRLIRRKTTQHGELIENKPSLVSKLIGDTLGANVMICTIRSPDDVEMDLTVTRGMDQHLGNFVCAAVTVMFDKYIRGRRNDYHSFDMGPFTRTDSGMTGTPLPNDAPLILVELAGFIDSTDKIMDIRAGLDDFPVTAAETNALIGAITDGTLVTHHRRNF